MEDTFKFTFNISDSKANHNIYPCQKSYNGMSFWALLISIFAYISIFYLFNLSPWVLFNTSKFWFLISNTLIIIIAADSGAFSSSKTNNPDPLDQFVSSTPHYNFRVFDTPNKYNKQEKESKNGTIENVPKATIISNGAEESKERSNAEMVQKCDAGEVVEETKPSNNNISDHFIEIHDDHKEEVTDHVKPFERSNSERVIRVIGGGDEDDKIGLRRSSTEKHDESNDVDEENDQFSSMSDEELNKRVEEFIRRFYNQQLSGPQRRRKVANLGVVSGANWVGTVAPI